VANVISSVDGHLYTGILIAARRPPVSALSCRRGARARKWRRPRGRPVRALPAFDTARQPGATRASLSLPLRPPPAG